MFKNFFKRLLNFLRVREVKYDDLGLKFHAYDLEALKERLQVELIASAAARNNMPGEAENTYGSDENMFIHYFEEEAQSIRHKVLAKLGIYDDKIINTNINEESNAVKIFLTSFETKVNSIVEMAKSSLNVSKNKVTDLNNELEDFKTKNKLTANADYPDSQFFHWCFLAGILLIEACINGIYFMKGSELGYFGGVFEAGIVAFINIGMGYFFGRHVFTQIYHIDKFRKYFIGVFLSLVIIAAAITFLLFIGHYRDLLTLTTDDVLKGSIQSFKDNPLGIQNYKSWLLVFVTFIFFIFAAFDGFKMDDPYPGFGRRDRRKAEAEDDYSEERSNLLDELDSEKIESLEQLDTLKTSAGSKIKDIRTIQSLRTNMVTQYNDHIKYLESCCNIIISVYREINTKKRESNPPGYFKNQFRFMEDKTIPTKTDVTVEVLKKQEQLFDEFSKQHASVEPGIENIIHQQFVALTEFDGFFKLRLES